MAKLADLLSADEAQSEILSRFRRLDVEEVALDDALGRVLAAPIASPLAVPPFANSSMDGFALRSEDVESATPSAPVSLRVVAQIPAGSAASPSVGTGECARIMTGGPLPAGADAVIPFEDVVERDDYVDLTRPVSPGACVRPAGNDIRPGDTLLPQATELDARDIGLLAATGHARISVVRRPVVAILATGNELVAPGNRLGPGQIFNSNTSMLSAAVREAGGIPRLLAPSSDEPGLIRSALQSVTARVDLILTSGGASVGDHDYIRHVLDEVSLWRVRVRPGKPVLFGRVGDTPVLGLPGNPTSAYVTFELFARPALRVMLGAGPMRPVVEVVVDDTIENGGGRRTFARVRLCWRDGCFHARLTGSQDSAMLLPLARANALLILPEDRAELRPGERGQAMVLAWPHEGDPGADS